MSNQAVVKALGLAKVFDGPLPLLQRKPSVPKLERTMVTPIKVEYIKVEGGIPSKAKLGALSDTESECQSDSDYDTDTSTSRKRCAAEMLVRDEKPELLHKPTRNLKKRRTKSTTACVARTVNWTVAQDKELDCLVRSHQPQDWASVAIKCQKLRTASECKARYERYVARNVKKGAWAIGEDEALLFHASRHVAAAEATESRLDWTLVALHIPNRTGKQCRERWVNHLSPTINKSEWSAAEDEKLLSLLRLNPRKWAMVARCIGNGRTENMVKVRFNALTRSVKTKKRCAAGEVKSEEFLSAAQLTEITNSRRKKKRTINRQHVPVSPAYSTDSCQDEEEVQSLSGVPLGPIFTSNDSEYSSSITEDDLLLNDELLNYACEIAADEFFGLADL